MDPWRTLSHVLRSDPTDQQTDFGIQDRTASAATFPGLISTGSFLDATERSYLGVTQSGFRATWQRS